MAVFNPKRADALFLQVLAFAGVGQFQPLGVGVFGRFAAFALAFGFDTFLFLHCQPVNIFLHH